MAVSKDRGASSNVSENAMTYEIIAVDWNKEQTRIWRHHVEKWCPGARITTIPDTRPIPHCWSSGKLACFSYSENPNLIYMDTDVIVTHDLKDVFDLMGDAKIGVSFGIQLNRFEKQKSRQIAELKEGIGYRWPPIGVSSGLMVLKGVDPSVVYDGWMTMMEYPPFRTAFKRARLEEEYALSLWLAHAYDRDEIYDIPLSVHGNICGGRHFGGVAVPWAIHYHKPERLKKYGMGGYLNIP